MSESDSSSYSYGFSSSSSAEEEVSYTTDIVEQLIDAADERGLELRPGVNDEMIYAAVEDLIYQLFIEPEDSSSGN